MRLSARMPGIVLTAAGIACAGEASSFDVAFLTDPVGPKALPLLVAAIFVVVGLHQAVKPNASSGWPNRAATARAGAATTAFLLYALLLPWFGFFSSTTLVVTALSRLFGAPLKHSAPAAAGLAGALWLLFVLGLGLPLPVGELWIL